MKQRLKQHPGFLIYDITRLFRQVFGVRLQDLNLSESRWRVLATVSGFPGISQTQLANHLAIGRAPLGELVDKLELEGLLTRRVDTADGRIKNVFVSPVAEPLIQEIMSRSLLLRDEFLVGIGSPLLLDLETVLKEMHGNIVRQHEDITAELPTEALSFMHLVSCISRLNRRLFDKQLKQIGFTRTQWLVLAAIGDAEGLSQTALAQTLSMARAPLGVLIDDLEHGERVERQADPNDRRAKRLFLTRQCKKEFAALSASFDELHNQSLERISLQRRNKLQRGLLQVRDNLKALAGSPVQS
jgi:MarR family transcriptional regulator for hemolysin